MSTLIKFLTGAGLGSRRSCFQLITQGKVTVNGIPATSTTLEIGEHGDIVNVNGKRVTPIVASIYLKINKPLGVLSAVSDKRGQRTVSDLVPKEFSHLHLFPVGRLDKDSEGLILLTDDGVIANQFLNAGEIHTRIYEVWTAYPITDQQMEDLSNGVDIGDYKTQPCDVIQTASRRIQIILKEGKNRQIRRMVRAVGNRIHRLRRVEFGPYQLGDLQPGEYRKI